MTRFIKAAILLQLVWLFVLTAPALAQSDEPGPATFVGSYTLWIAIVIGFAAALATLYFGYQLKGGLVGGTLTLFGAGMFFVVLGFLAVVVAWTTQEIAKIVHDLVFIIGYSLMLLGATRLRKLA